MSRRIMDVENDTVGKLFEKANDNFEEVYAADSKQDSEIKSKASQADFNTLKARVDNITKIPAESTEGNAELLDIRVGADGKTYNTAGEAVRDYSTFLLDKIDVVAAVLGTPIDFSMKGYLTGTGDIHGEESPYGDITDWIRVEGYDRVLFNHLYGNKDESVAVQVSVGIVCFYDNNKTFISSAYNYLGYSSDVVKIPRNAIYARLCRWTKSLTATRGSAYLIRSSNTNIMTEVLRLMNSTQVDFSINGFIRANGNYELSNAASMTDWLDVSQYDYVIFSKLLGNYGDSVSVSDTVGIVCFYDNNKTFISSAYKYTGIVSDIVKIPENAIYARLCKWIDVSEIGDAWLGALPSSKTEIIREIPTNINESINKPFDFKGKTINAFGDSITAGVTSPNLQAGTPYIKYFADKVGANLLNWAVSGSTISVLDSWSPGSICTKFVDQIAAKDINDFIIIAGGTNDFNQSREIGEFSSTDDSTLYGALRKICEHIKSDMPDRTVIFITPIPYTKAYYDQSFPDRINNLGYTLSDYSRAIFDIATAYGHSVVDGSSLGMPTGNSSWDNLMCDNSDGCHPSSEGHKLYARSLAGKLL